MVCQSNHGGDWIGIWRSEDRGQTWVPSDEGIRTEEYNSSSTSYLLRSPHNPEQMVASSGGEIYYSEDGGRSWTAESSDRFKSDYSIFFEGFKWHPADPNIIWVYGLSGFSQAILAKSENAGEYWERYTNLKVPVNYHFLDIAFDASNPELVYMAAHGAVIKSETGGEDWTNLGEMTKAFEPGDSSFFALDLEAHPQNGGVFYISGGPNLYRYSTAGNQLVTIDTPEQMNSIYDLWFDEHRQVLYVAGEFGVFAVKHID